MQPPSGRILRSVANSPPAMPSAPLTTLASLPPLRRSARPSPSPRHGAGRTVRAYAQPSRSGKPYLVIGYNNNIGSPKLRFRRLRVGVSRTLLLAVLAVALVAVSGLYAYSHVFIKQPIPNSSTTQNTSLQVRADGQYNVSVVSGLISGSPRMSFFVAVVQGENNAYLLGTFMAGDCLGGEEGCTVGHNFIGYSSDVATVLVLSSSDYQRYVAGASVNPIYNSTAVQGGLINVPLSNGSYYVAFESNGYSDIEANINLVFSTQS